MTTDPNWKKANKWLNIVPWGFRKALNWVKSEYNNPVIYVTENGCPDSELNDVRRIEFYQVKLTLFGFFLIFLRILIAVWFGFRVISVKCLKPYMKTVVRLKFTLLGR